MVRNNILTFLVPIMVVIGGMAGRSKGENSGGVLDHSKVKKYFMEMYNEALTKAMIEQEEQKENQNQEDNSERRGSFDEMKTSYQSPFLKKQDPDVSDEVRPFVTEHDNDFKSKFQVGSRLAPFKDPIDTRRPKKIRPEVNQFTAHSYGGHKHKHHHHKHSHEHSAEHKHAHEHLQEHSHEHKHTGKHQHVHKHEHHHEHNHHHKHKEAHEHKQDHKHAHKHQHQHKGSGSWRRQDTVEGDQGILLNEDEFVPEDLLVEELDLSPEYTAESPVNYLDSFYNNNVNNNLAIHSPDYQEIEYDMLG